MTSNDLVYCNIKGIPYIMFHKHPAIPKSQSASLYNQPLSRYPIYVPLLLVSPKFQSFGSRASHFWITGCFEASALNDLKITPNSERLNVPHIWPVRTPVSNFNCYFMDIHFRVRGYFETSAPNDLKITLNITRSKLTHIYFPSTTDSLISAPFTQGLGISRIFANFHCSIGHSVKFKSFSNFLYVTISKFQEVLMVTGGNYKMFGWTRITAVDILKIVFSEKSAIALNDLQIPLNSKAKAPYTCYSSTHECLILFRFAALWAYVSQIIELFFVMDYSKIFKKFGQNQNFEIPRTILWYHRQTSVRRFGRKQYFGPMLKKTGGIRKKLIWSIKKYENREILKRLVAQR